MKSWCSAVIERFVCQDCYAELAELGPYTLIVCDMNSSCEDALAALKPALDLMPSGARLIFTIKLGSRTTAAAERACQRATAVLSPYFEVDEVCWLFANRLRERTLLATRK
eukprot:TRINITY_DN9016_c0_g1_i1.p3 TRINITY_DN9016_c0_g1~~TRINITY_DN9016_c0_g1_i1.p3  ORF type:complete len:111 (+),score=12.28 TRINITY_DN9016_c0_g1_i1:1023-1355(+)